MVERHTTVHGIAMVLSVFCAGCFLSACGGGEGGGGGGGGNLAPYLLVTGGDLGTTSSAMVDVPTTAYDPDGGAITVTWVVVSGPADGVAATWVAPTTMRVAFPVYGDWVVKAIASDGRSTTTSATVTVRITAPGGSTTGETLSGRLSDGTTAKAGVTMTLRWIPPVGGTTITLKTQRTPADGRWSFTGLAWPRTAFVIGVPVVP